MGGADPVNDAAHLSRLTDWCECMHAYMDISIQVNALTYIHTYIHNAHWLHVAAGSSCDNDAINFCFNLDVLSNSWTTAVFCFFFNCTSRHTAKWPLQITLPQHSHHLPPPLLRYPRSPPLPPSAIWQKERPWHGSLWQVPWRRTS